jgi:hypothetical protein
LEGDSKLSEFEKINDLSHPTSSKHSY